MKEGFWSPRGSQPFIYDEISTPQTIRLLRLDVESDTISISLHTTTIANAPPYCALSYCWGPPTPAVAISCNNRRLRVTLNLAQAMQRLQQLSHEASEWDLKLEWFWIDQICINQMHSDERSSQVQLMRSIYAGAARTLIWLGPSQGSCHLGWTLVDQIYDVFRRENPDATHMSDISTRLYSSSYHMSCGLPDWNDDLWKHFRKILQAPWFRRTWVIQEVAVSQRDPLILHGNRVYPWDRLGWASTWLRRVGFIRLHHVPSQLLNVDTISNIRRSQVRWTLPALLMATSGKFLATDPRDKIFGLLGLILETEQPTFPAALIPDYHRTTAQVYRDVTKFLISEYRNLAILDRTIARVGRFAWSPTPPSIAAVESWVPNWSVLTEPSQPRYLSWATYHGGRGGADLGFPENYRAAADLPTSMVATTDEHLLQLWGLRVDSVVSVSGIASNFTLLLGDGSAPGPPLLRKFEETTLLDRFVLMLASVLQKPLFLRYWHLALGGCEGTSPVDLIDAFIKCTTADHFHLAGSKPEQIRKDGCAYLLSQLQVAKERKGFLSPISLPLSFSSHKQSPYLKALQDHAVGGNPKAYESLARNYCLNRRFFITLNGRIGIGPKWTKKGDLVCVLFGGGVPYILRPRLRHYKFIGESYVHGLMDGQAIDARCTGGLKEELFGLH